jgi:hypothetical protein
MSTPQQQSVRIGRSLLILIEEETRNGIIEVNGTDSFGK